MNIYLRQVIELDLDQLPEGEEVLSILRQEAPPLNTWLKLAVSLLTLLFHEHMLKLFVTFCFIMLRLNTSVSVI